VEAAIITFSVFLLEVVIAHRCQQSSTGSIALYGLLNPVCFVRRRRIIGFSHGSLAISWFLEIHCVGSFPPDFFPE
jgi:hypothetical protein